MLQDLRQHGFTEGCPRCSLHSQEEHRRARVGGDTATVSVTVTCVDDGPAIANNDSVTVDENSSLNTINVLLNDTPDPDDDSLAVTGVGAPS